MRCHEVCFYPLDRRLRTLETKRSGRKTPTKQMGDYAEKLDEKIGALQSEIDGLKNIWEQLVGDEEHTDELKKSVSNHLNKDAEPKDHHATFTDDVARARPSSAVERSLERYIPRDGAGGSSLELQTRSLISDLRTENRRLYWKNWELQRENDDMKHDIEMARIKLERYARPRPKLESRYSILRDSGLGSTNRSDL